MIFNKNDNKHHEILGYHKIAQACSHFKSFKNLDYRAHFLTIHLHQNWQKNVSQAIYRQICRTLSQNGFMIDGLDPGLVLEHDREGSRDGHITNDLPHFHGLLFTDYEEHYGKRLKINYLIDQSLKSLVDVKSSETSLYDPRETLGYTSDYNAKWSKLKSEKGIPDNFLGHIYPIDKVRVNNCERRVKRQFWMDRSDAMLRLLYDDQTQFFSNEYCSKFGKAMNELMEYGRGQQLYIDKVAA